LGASLDHRKDRMANQTLAKYVNELSILTMLRNRGIASRADIARRLSLTPATITRLTGRLVERGLVKEAQAPQARGPRELGRPSVGLAINAEGAFFLGVEIAVDAVRFALIDLAVMVVTSTEMAITPPHTPQSAVKVIAAYLKSLQRDDRYKHKILSVGVTLPALVVRDGMVINFPAAGWADVQFAELLNKAIKLPCYIENDAHAAAFGEVYTQPAISSLCTLYLWLGTGVGGAAIINNRLFRGAHGTAGLLGHVKVKSNGQRCSCGNNGCLESCTNLAALARSYLGPNQVLDGDLNDLPAHVASRAAAGEPAAQAAVAEMVSCLTIGLTSITSAFNPSVIILGGPMLPIFRDRAQALRAAIASGVLFGVTAPEIRMSQLGHYDCAIGAATIAHHNSFDLSRVTLLEPELHP
jgi:predicted NBD/HSP70 family sugar kinase